MSNTTNIGTLFSLKVYQAYKLVNKNVYPGCGMQVQFHFEKRDGTRAYKQLSAQILEMIRTNVLKPGDRIWPERQLAEMTGLARGTVKRAYARLQEDGILEARVGGGHYIVRYPDDAEEQRMRMGAERVESLFEDLARRNFSAFEIYALVRERLHRLVNEQVWVNVAAVECSKMGCKQLAEDLACIPNIAVTQLEITDIPDRMADPGFFSAMDLIVTTTAHYSELCQMLSPWSDRIVEVFFSLTNESISQFHTIKPNSRIGVITANHLTFTSIRATMESFNIRFTSMDAITSKDADEVRAASRGMDVLILATDSLMMEADKYRAVIDDFVGKGGTVVMFSRLLERASRKYTEDLVAKLVARKCSEFAVANTGRNYLRMV